MTDPAGRLRASRADREQVIETLKSAFVDDRLTKDELDMRVSQALLARTYADLAALTADLPVHHLPADRATAAAVPAPRRDRPLARAAARSAACLIVATTAIWLGLAFGGPSAKVFLFLTVAAAITALGIMGNVIAASFEQRQSRKNVPPGPRPTRRVQPPAPGQRHIDQPRADMRAHESHPRRRLWPVRVVTT